MKKLYDEVSEKCSKYVTRHYSTSFSLGIKFLHESLQQPIYAIYGFVRLADEIVDSFHGYNKVFLLNQLKIDTSVAIENKISLNPILNSFQAVVHRYTIDQSLIDSFLQSMEMDLNQHYHSDTSYQEYILGSAEVVGLMCLKVFSENNPAIYNNLKPYAMKLGAAFQKVNFLRDFKYDYNELGRVYFPGIDFNNFDVSQKESIEREITEDFKTALIGIRKLPKGSKSAVYLAYYYYHKLFLKIKHAPVHSVLNNRIRIPNAEKMGLMLKSFIRFKLNYL